MINKELRSMSFEELVQLRQNGQITLVEFIEQQPDLAEAWSEWKVNHPGDDISAKYFLSQYEENMMKG